MPHLANQSSFQSGYDPRRLVFSQAERRKGYRVATQEKNMPSRLRAWLRTKIRCYYHERREDPSTSTFHAVHAATATGIFFIPSAGHLASPAFGTVSILRTWFTRPARSVSQ
jgi:hypothetical protein